HASTSSYHVAQDRWSRDQHIELVNSVGDPGEGMLARSMAAKLTAASASKCLFADFLSKIEPKKVFESLSIQDGLMLCKKSLINSIETKSGLLFHSLMKNSHRLQMSVQEQEI
nr:retrovirus-related Pol polyprotein from transposon TNT 1-94 [Tanacetum cinerariifolium]